MKTDLRNIHKSPHFFPPAHFPEDFGVVVAGESKRWASSGEQEEKTNGGGMFGWIGNATRGGAARERTRDGLGFWL